MNSKGYLLLPRSLMDQEWYGNLSCRLLALHLLQVASYRATEHPILGDLPVGSYVTTYRELAHEIERDVKTVDRAIKRMAESGFLEVAPMAKCIVLQVVWSDFVELRDCCDATKVATNPATKGATNSIAAKDSVSASCNDSANDPATKVATNPATDIATNINKKEINITNTQTSIDNPGSNKNAPARDAYPRMSAQAQALSEWITKHTPEIAAMEVPLTPEQLEYLSAKYDSGTLHRAMTDCESTNGHLRHRRAFNAVQIYLDYDRRVKQSNKLYTYDEFCDQLKRYGRRQDEFTLVEVGGRKLWKRIS